MTVQVDWKHQLETKTNQRGSLMIIGVTGHGATGASACIDLLKEFEGV